MFHDPRTVRQVAALPYVDMGDGIEVLLITSRERGRWLLPKGWPANGRGLAEQAKREAKEEAGVTGTLHTRSVGTYTYSKQMPEGYAVPCTVFVYPLRVEQHRLDWPEKAQRTLRWCRLEEAVELVDDRDLARLLASLARSEGDAFSMAAEPGEEAGVTTAASSVM